MSLSSFLFSAALRFGASAISHHAVGVVVQFSSFQAFQQFVALASWACVPHRVAISGFWSSARWVPVCSVAFGQLPAGGL